MIIIYSNLNRPNFNSNLLFKNLNRNNLQFHGLFIDLNEMELSGESLSSSSPEHEKEKINCRKPRLLKTANSKYFLLITFSF